MDLKTKKLFFFILLVISAVSFGYRLSLLTTEDKSVSNYAILLTFFLVCIMSFYEWIKIRKRLGEFK